MLSARLWNGSTDGLIRVLFGAAFYQGVFEDAAQMISGVLRDVCHSCWENTTDAASVDGKLLEGSIEVQSG